MASEAPPRRRRPGDPPREVEDCLGCKLSGAAACAFASGYSFWQRSTLPPVERTNRRFLAGFGAVWLGLGVARLAWSPAPRESP